MATRSKKTPARSARRAPRADHAAATLAALDRSLATIEFDPDGTILTANQNFLTVVGYSLDEIVGRHHSMFVTAELRDSTEYASFWRRLGRGEFEGGEYQRVGRGGRELWLQASYNPIVDRAGRTVKVIKFAANVTDQVRARNESVRLRTVVDDAEAAIMMIDRDFNVTYANQSTKALLKQHEGTFRSVWPSFDATKILGANVDQFHKDPSHQRRLLSDPNRLPYRTDIKVGPLTFELLVGALRDNSGRYVGNSLEWKDVTAARAQDNLNADFRGQIAAISKSQAVIEFDLDGKIRTANQNFLETLGYRLDEIQGKHHSMFAEPSYRESAEYRRFWDELAAGKYQAGEFKRVGNGGKEIWIQATYNPIADASGRPVKVVKFASDITAQKKRVLETQAFVAEMSATLEQVAAQDLTVRMTGTYSGPQATTMSNLNSALEALETALTAVSSTSAQVAGSSRQIAEGSQSVAQGASTQAASIEEISASLEELSAMTSQNADNAVQVNSVSATAAEAAERGRTIMQEMQRAIDAIATSSSETAKIVKTIDEISFQTNMLALNAAVEAARAGDAGRGFAVVAEEVRALAMRSAEAAKTTSRLIEESSRNAANGVSINGSVRLALDEINEATTKVRSLVGEIAAASKEQADGIGQITTAVDQMNQVTQENAANSEQSSAAAAELDQQVERLAALIGQFTLTVGAGEDAVEEPAPRRRASAGEPQPALPRGRVKPGPNASIAKAKGPAPRKPAAAGRRNPSQVIPLDDAELQDF
jgi:methyl-accepting chemotaxis protein